MAYRLNLSLHMRVYLIQWSTQLRKGFTKPQVIAILLFGLFIFVSTLIPHFSAILVVIILAAFAYEAYTTASTESIVQPSTSIPEVDTDLANLHNFLYMKQQYLHSQQWKDKRKLVIARDCYRCTSCGSLKDLQVHHKSHYLSIPNEPLSALTTLCGTCHTELHERIGYPQTYQDYANWSH